MSKILFGIIDHDDGRRNELAGFMESFGFETMSLFDGRTVLENPLLVDQCDALIVEMNLEGKVNGELIMTKLMLDKDLQWSKRFYLLADNFTKEKIDFLDALKRQHPWIRYFDRGNDPEDLANMIRVAHSFGR